MMYCFLQKNIGFKLPIVIVFKLDIFFFYYYYFIDIKFGK